jgi:hypothetical protein
LIRLSFLKKNIANIKGKNLDKKDPIISSFPKKPLVLSSLNKLPIKKKSLHKKLLSENA